MDDLRFFNPYAEIRQTQNRLPHWQQAGAVYFVTFRLADAVPSRLRTQWEGERNAWLRVHPEPWSFEVELEYHQRFSGAIEHWLDAGHGSCLLREPACAEVVSETIRHFEGERVVMISAVVMPNHAHALFVQNPDWPLENCFAVGKDFQRGKLTSCWSALAIVGNATTSIGSCVTRTISRIACATFGAIRKTHD